MSQQEGERKQRFSFTRRRSKTSRSSIESLSESDYLSSGSFGSNHVNGGRCSTPPAPEATLEYQNSGSGRGFRIPGRLRRTRSSEPTHSNVASVPEPERLGREASVSWSNDSKTDHSAMTLENVLPSGFIALSRNPDLVISNQGMCVRATRTCMVVGNQIIPTDELKRVALRRKRQRDGSVVSAGRTTPDSSLSNLVAKKPAAGIHAYPSLDITNSSSMRGTASMDNLDRSPNLQLATTTSEQNNRHFNSSDIFYFEVTLKTNSVIRIGLVAEEEVRLAGEAPNSIALSSDGTLWVSGRVVANDLGMPSMEAGVTLGLGVEILGMRRIFFTRNGALLALPSSFSGLTVHDIPCVPALVLIGQPSSVVEATGRFMYNFRWKGSEQLSVIPANEALLDDARELNRESTSDSYDSNLGSHVNIVPESRRSEPNLVTTRQIAPIFGRKSNRRSSLEDDLPNVDGVVVQNIAPEAYVVPIDTPLRNTSRFPQPRSISPRLPRSQLRSSSDSTVPSTFGVVASTPVLLLTSSSSYSPSRSGRLMITTPNELVTSTGYAPSSSREEDDQLNAALKQSSQTKKENKNKVVLMTQRDIEDAKSCARELRTCCQKKADVSLVKNVLELCRSMQDTVKSALEDAMKYDSSIVDLEELFTLNDIVLDAIGTAERTLENEDESSREIMGESSKLSATGASDSYGASSYVHDVSSNSNLYGAHEIASTPTLYGSSSTSFGSSTPSFLKIDRSAPVKIQMTPLVRRQTTRSLDIEALVRKKDVFSLICMLRAQSDKRLDSAIALMTFAREAERTGDMESIRLRNEIRSSGGMHSLLTLFRTKGTTRELKVVSALAVAYLLPSVVESTQLSSPTVGLRIVECLRCLLLSRSMSPNGEEISRSDMFNASAMGLTTFWINAFSPMIQIENARSGGVATAPQQKRGAQYRSRGWQLQVGTGGGTFDQSQLEVQELLAMTVSLIVNMAKLDDKEIFDTEPPRLQTYDSKLNLRYTLVEQMCALDVARPIAVREGLLKVLVCWMKSKDTEKVRPAATALRDLTSTQDKYMAGWIHSQIVSEGALREIVELAVAESVGHEVRLGVAQILSSLCVAPHTRAAVVEAQCINYLIPLLYNHSDSSSQQVAFAAGSALLQLAAGAMTLASVYSAEDLDNEAASSDKRDTVISDIVHGGAIGQFVAMARSCNRGMLRAMSIEALRVISEDKNPTRLTRLQLCEDGAVEALGRVLKDDVCDVCNMLRRHDRVEEFIMERQASDQLSPSGVVRELHQALCALANILDLAEGIAGALPPVLQYTQSRLESYETTLIRGCIQTAQSGGLLSLLRIVYLPFTKDVLSEGTEQIDQADLLVESSRCLASLSPLLLSDLAVDEGFTSWTCQVLHALTFLLKQSAENEENDETGLWSELKNDALRGLSALAKSEPLKILIIDKSLQYLLQAKVQRGDRTDVSNAAGQVCLSLGFADDELAVQVAGNDPKLLGDWFCLQRSLLIQAMARREIRRVLASTWKEALAEARRKGIFPPPKLVRENSGQSSSSSTNRSLCGDESVEGIEDFFENISTDEESAEQQSLTLQQYANVYENSGNCVDLIIPVDQPSTSSLRSNELSDDGGLLARQVYPLDNADNEKNWILSHKQSMLPSAKDGMVLVMDRVQRLLDNCIPSRLLQNEILPLYDLCPEASFNFRALVMAQRRYFSFKREGQLVSRLCDKHAAALDSDNLHWTLGFTNSSFAGEFSETLVQALYRCPMIRGLSFARNAEWKVISSMDKGSEADDGSALLANLAGSLPPWVSYLTYDNILNDRAVKALVAILETMEKLIAGQGPRQDSSRMLFSPRHSESVSQKQGSFWFFAIRNTPQLGAEIWGAFFELLGSSVGPSHGSPSPRPLSSLRILDLSGNNLGDDLCASVLGIAHDKHSSCSLEQLDLSMNKIRQGTKVIGILRSYVQLHRYNQSAGVKIKKRTWRSSLHTLNLSSNELFTGGLALEIIAYLKNNALTLKSLDISCNGLEAENYQFTEVLCGSLIKNTCLRKLNISSNSFNSIFLDAVIDRLNRSEFESGLTSLCIDNNSPALNDKQNLGFETFLRRTRTTALERYISVRERLKRGEIHGESLHDSVITESNPYLTSQGFRTRDDIEDISIATTDSTLRRPPVNLPEKGENMITVLFSAPLVFHDEQRKLRPFAKLDFDMERELLWQCLKEASRDIELSFDNATPDRLVAAMTKRCSCLHYSGHGHPTYLPLENGRGGPNWLEVNVLEDLILQEEAPFKFVFVSACHSGLAGETFASAGVPHVVCCQQESELKDAAALTFTRHFYLALAVGHTVKNSFEQGCKAVRVSPNLRNAEDEMNKFVLLPRDGNHDVPIFNANPLREWPKTGSNRSLRSKTSKRSGLLQRSRSSYFGGAKSSELSVRNMMQEDPSPTPPQFFLGREVEMYHVLNAILTKRLVTVVGETGVGKSSLVCAICHYINERSSTILEVDRIFFVKTKQGCGGDRFRLLIQSLLDKLVEAGKADLPVPGTDMEDLFEIICRALKSTKALIVFDRTELMEGNDEAQDFPLFLSNLFRETRNVRVMLTGRQALGIPSIGGVVEQPYYLGPLNFGNTVRLFANLCPHLHTPGERQKFFHQLVTDCDIADCISTDSGITERTKVLFKKLGDGKPSGTEKAAYGIPVEEVRSLGS